jgi:hypothetical protein
MDGTEPILVSIQHHYDLLGDLVPLVVDTAVIRVDLF